MKRLGPDLKMPKLGGSGLKVPPFLADLYWDLYDRRLLPLVGLIVVAIVAVPFLLGGGSEETPQPSRAAEASLRREIAKASSFTVVRAEPGLREYRKRLVGRKPSDPFKEKFGKPSLKGAKLELPGEGGSGSSSAAPTTTAGGGESQGGSGSAGSPVTTGSPGSTTSPGTTESTPPSSGNTGGGNSGGGSSGGSGTKKKPHLIFFTYAVDVRVSRSGGKNADSETKKQEPVVKHRVLPQTSLPGEKAPVVTYLGPARKGKKATGKVLLLVSNKVQAVFGETHCVSGEDVCQLLEVEPGFPVTFVYGANEVHYTINVLKVELVVTGRT